MYTERRGERETGTETDKYTYTYVRARAHTRTHKQVHITEEPERNKGRAKTGITELQPNIDKAIRPGHKPRQIGYWCFSAGVTMREIMDAGVRNVLLASGTLSPMSSWAVEMQMDFSVQLENTHVIGADQLLAAVVKRGPGGQTLNASYRNKDNMQSVDDLGNLVLNVSRVVPQNSGVLVFFPSYAAMTAMSARWQQGPQRVWDRIGKIKRIFQEPREAGSFKGAVDAFTAEVDRADSHGAVLMAVCRGKMSEGIDFADRHGRAVIVTGIPFPAYLDPRVVLKRAFMDELMPAAKAARREAVSGEQWYIQQAARAVNQAIGRVIRHRTDYGVILLCDERFAGWPSKALLSKWMSDKVLVADQFGPVIRQLTEFFQKHKQSEAPPKGGASAPLPTELEHGAVALHSRAAPVAKASRVDSSAMHGRRLTTSLALELEEGYRARKPSSNHQHTPEHSSRASVSGGSGGGGGGSSSGLLSRMSALDDAVSVDGRRYAWCIRARLLVRTHTWYVARMHAHTMYACIQERAHTRECVLAHKLSSCIDIDIDVWI